ncbi:MAG: alpha-L-rhamnosidase N-terminal domain-containing protein [Steroidobacteraceae bacterium]
MKRRGFIKLSAIAGASALVVASDNALAANSPASSKTSSTGKLALPASRWTAGSTDERGLTDLSPARWIWYPSERTLPNTFVLFRRDVELIATPIKATGWIVGDSRYKLEVNGKRIQWGPAPCDPRWTEADPVDLSGVLQSGKNVLGATVLYYGHGDGTWPTGNPGFLFWLTIDYANGTREVVVSDATWRVNLCRAWPPGRYKRHLWRALQEEFDARLYPDGWNTPGFMLNSDWLSAMAMDASPNKPAICTNYNNYLTSFDSPPSYSDLRPRAIPLLDELLVPVERLAETLWIKWLRPAAEYFENRGPSCFTVDRTPSATEVENGRWQATLEMGRGAVLTFELPEQVVGFPYFSITAHAGTTVDLITQEAHRLGGTALLYTTATYGWTRFVCREGQNAFECFDFESLRWVQVHIQGHGIATVHSVGVRRRLFPWRNRPLVRSNDTQLQRLFDASINTIKNAATDQFADGNGRERQQYAGDASHQVSTSLLAFGDARLAARYLSVWSQGSTKEGLFLDPWPANEKLELIGPRLMELTQFGPQLDAGTQFGFDAWNYYQFTGDLEPLREAYPRLLRFANYLIGLINRDGDGLIPVTDLGMAFVWLDWDPWPFDKQATSQRRKQCSFNLYAAGMFERALAPMCIAFGNDPQAGALRKVARSLVSNTVRRFWSGQRQLFVDNLPWLNEEGEVSLSDRALAHAVLFDQCPGGATAVAIQALAKCPKEMGLSYPANALWRLWALAKGGRIDVVLNDLRARWATLPSVTLNNTLQESWTTEPDTGSQWSHSAVAPLSVAHLCLVGLRPLTPGFRRAEMQPQLGGLEDFELMTYTGQGSVHFKTSGEKGARQLSLTIPDGCTCDVLLRAEEQVELKSLQDAAPPGYRRYRLPSGKSTDLHLRLT